MSWGIGVACLDDEGDVRAGFGEKEWIWELAYGLKRSGRPI